MIARGIDIGGTKIAAGLVDVATGRLVRRAECPTGAADGGAVVLARAASLLLELGGTGPLGVGMPEVVSPEGVILTAAAFDWRGLLLETAFGSRPVLGSDVQAAARAEARFGAAAGHDPVLFVSVGTGVSSCLLLNGRPMPGARGAALVMASGLLSAPDGTRFGVEAVAGGPGLLAIANAGGGAAYDDTRAVIAAAAAGDLQALAAVRTATQVLGGAVALLAGALDPARIVIGGGLGSAPGAYWEGLKAAIRDHAWPGLPAPEVVQAALGPDAGIVGAALMAVAA